ncbi:MAG TPA: hypothetical protein VFG67_08740 [Oleiagrimonas sp.]|nr:hypothetical protein [Oleiagrimonas sp.]
MRFNIFSLSHGWRGFLLEIAIVVIGVLIALWTGQLAETWNWRHKVDVAEGQLQRESAPNFFVSAEQVVVAPCVDAQLAALQTRLLASGDVLDPAPLYKYDLFRYVYRAPSRSYPSVAWHAINGDGTAAHLDNRRHDQYAEAYTYVAVLEQMARESDNVLGRLTVLGAAIPLDASTRAGLLGDIEEQRSRNGLQSIVALQLMGTLRDLGVAPPTEEVVDGLEKNSGTTQFCREHQLPVADWRTALAALPSA